jgi:phosphoribosylformylglycinamidine synthase
MYHVLVGESCYTASEVQKLVQRINDQSPVKVAKLTGSWQYYVDLETEDPAVLASIKKILEAIEQPADAPATENNGKSVDIYVTPRNVSPWSSKATSIALVCDLKTVNRIERGRVIHIEFEGTYNGEQDLVFRDVVHDRMTEFFSLSPPVLDTMFAHGIRHPLEVVDIFSDERGPLAALQEHNKKAGLGLDEPNMEYLVKQYTALGRSPV